MDLSWRLIARFPRRDRLLPNQDFRELRETRHVRANFGISTKIRRFRSGNNLLDWLLVCLAHKCGRIPIDDLHEFSSEGEGACLRTCAGRSHLPLRGKLGWMTPRPGQKKTGKRNAPLGALVLKRGPFFFPSTVKPVTRLPQAPRGQALESALV